MLKDKTILVVEDNVFLALDLSSVIEEVEGHVVGPVVTAAEAYQLLEAHSVAGAVVACDVVDAELAQIMMQLAERKIPVVIHTTTPLPPETIEILPTAPVLLKPIHTRIVLAQLAEAIAKRSDGRGALGEGEIAHDR